MHSESEYQAESEGSLDGFDPQEKQRQRLRPHSRQRNYQAMLKEPKPAVEKRLTRGIYNPLSSQIANINEKDRRDDDVDDEPHLQQSQYDDEPNVQEEDQSSIFHPEIGLILWRRERQHTQEDEYLVKFKGRSYLHTSWLTEQQIEGLGKPIKNKLNRFNKNFLKRLQEMNYDQDAILEGKYFDPSYLEVDRILTATEMFPVIHQKKANQIKGKWSESIAIVCSKLLNFTKNNVHYGVLFCQPVNPQNDNCPEYTKIIQQPMDLGTILNKVFLDIYKSYKQFWYDVGLVYKNCLKYNKEERSDLRLLGLTQRQCAIFLYNQWYNLCEERYKQLKQQLADKLNQNKNEQQQQHNEEKIPTQMMNEENKQQKQQKQKQIKQQKDTIKFTNGISGVSDDKNSKICSEIKQKSSKSQYQSSEEGQIKEKRSEDDQQKRKAQMDTPHQSSKKQQNGIQQDRQVLNMQFFYERNIFLSMKKVQIPTNKEQLELLNPGQFNYQWLEEEGDGTDFMSYNYQHIDMVDMRNLDLNVEADKLYMVKWKNLSYSEATWELESAIGAPDKIAQFKLINKTLGKDHRTLMQSQMQRHNILLDVQTNIKKRRNYSNASLNEIKNKLYFYDVASKKPLHQYTQNTIPIYRNYKILRSYQLDSLNWLIKSWYEKRNTILADEMGLGKTIQSIAFLYHLYTFENVKGPFLVIAPLSTLEHWKRTIQDWTTLNCILYYDQNGQTGRRSIQYYEWYHTNITMKGSYLPSQLNKFQILLTSYEVFLLDFNPVIMNVPFQFIVVDEAHRLKNKNAKILATLKKLPCTRVLLLTGTPIQNNTNQLWSLLNYIEPAKFGNFQDFRRQFGDLVANEQIQNLNRSIKPYMLRRMKEDVEQSIPPLQETIIDVEMTNIQKTIYRALFQKNKSMLLKGVSAVTSYNTNLNNLQIQLRKCCNHPFLIKQLEADLLQQCPTQAAKIDKLISSSGKMVLVKMLLEKCKKEGKKVLIFSQFTHMLQLIEEFLRFCDYKYERIDGQIKAKERQSSIDRYNNPDKKRDVFLLSTKAGGVGINLTSANVVIIYDSDWNPQNDVQATARAHRIGQKSEVQVYRLVTCNTYEAQMFERANQKLGLDKAIFIGGHFKQTGNNNAPESKLSKNEMETLLKKGILGFLENKGNQSFFDLNVDEIIEKNSRVAKYSLINGSCSFSKSRFVSDNADNALKINDPNFWNIVLKNVESRSQALLKKAKNLQSCRDSQSQRQMMGQAAQLVNSLIQTKLSLSGFNADDEINLSEFLTIVSSERQFSKNYRDLASSWLEEILKPSRRFKKLTIDDSIGKKVLKKVARPEQEDNNALYDSHHEQEEEQSLSGQKRKLNDLKKEDFLKRICFLCEKSKCIFHCSGFCKRAFHEECKQKVEQEGLLTAESLNEKFQAKEIAMDPQMIKSLLQVNYTCQDCQNNLISCFICKKKGQYFGAQYQKTKKTKKGKDHQREIDEKQTNIIKSNTKKKNQVTKCSTANCAKFYHPKCIEQYDTNKLFRFIDLNSLHFRCSLHYCHKCGISGDTMSIFQCIRCPKALHIRCMDKDKVVKISKKQFICDCHLKNKRQFKKISQKFTVTIPKKNVMKSEKIEKKKKQKEELSKSEESQSEHINHGYKTRRNRNNSIEQTDPILIQGEKRVRNRQKVQLITYQQLGIVPINAFNFSSYQKDWCRYCGSRYSSNFTQGPWGSKTLCTVHYINWKQSKTLNLDEYVAKPQSPINPDSEQQLKYLSGVAQKNPEIPIENIITFLQSKKMKKTY